MKVRLQTETEVGFTLEVENTVSIQGVKEKIAANTGIPLEQQRLFHSAQELGECDSVEQHAFALESGAVFFVVAPRTPMRFPLKLPTGRTVEVVVGCSATIEELKWRLEALYGYPRAHQLIIFAGKHLCNGTCMQDYNLKKDAIAHLVDRSGTGPRAPP